ncbi:helix-turn-helix domain-containing protein [Undibacterium fentianense]|uniref:Helix-turn-helix transcriptional regulator n=1 Tax=Undibacterium fentianense TaxID=2828728 RepID=A0A941E9A6_9BURK|nr:helix-turn-helix transcriptional regulator [Undibacterium fentianense]MBR7800978.1 helix-turn-helix transcriptional regulator [Undibacterium fentianense]
MTKASSLIDVLKRELKARRITYQELASKIGISESSIKRMFASKNLSLQRLDQILDAAQINLHDLTSRSYEESLIDELTYEQEEELISDPKKFIVAVSAMNYLSLHQIIEIYAMSETEVIAYLVRLDHLGIIELMPNNRIKLLLSRTFRWIPNGPIQNFHRRESFADYLDSNFDGKNDMMQFVSVMLSKQSSAIFLTRLMQLARDISDQHRLDANLPFEEKFRMSFMLSARPWIPNYFQALVRPEYIRNYYARKERNKRV